MTAQYRSVHFLWILLVLGILCSPVIAENSWTTNNLMDLQEGNCDTIEIDIHFTDDTVLGCGVAGDYIAANSATWMLNAALSACSDFDNLGFRSPYQTDLPDFDFYVDDEANGGGGTAIWDCIGLDPAILRCDPEITIRLTTSHEMFHNIQRKYLCDMGLPCDSPVYMGSTFGKWVAEGTARFSQDKLDLDSDNITGDSVYYWDTANEFLDSWTDDALVTVSYRAALFWNYFCEQIGTVNTEPDYGIDFLVAFWENYVTLATTDSISVLEQTIADMGDGRGLNEYFLDFEICNITKDFDVSGILHGERYQYQDEQQAGATPYNSVDPTDAVVGITDSNESVEELAARFYEITPNAMDCEAIGFKGDLDDMSQNAGWALIGIKDDGGAGQVDVLLKGIGSEFGGAVLQRPEDPYTRLVGVVVGLDAGVMADIDFDYTFETGVLTPDIVSPTTLSPMQTGVPGDGVTAARFIVRVFVDGPADLKPSPASSVQGLLAGDFDVTVGGASAEVIASALVGGDYFLVVESIQSSDGIKDLEVAICDNSDVQAGSLLFSDIQIDEMIAIDVSGSMGDPGGTSKLDAAKIAASLYVDAVGDDDRVGVVSFSGDFTDNENAGPGGVCNDDATVLESLDTASFIQRENCKTEIANLTDGGWTSIGDGLLASQGEFDADPMTSRVIVLLSDGYENEAAFWNDTYSCSGGSSTDPVDDTLVPSDTIVHTIAFGPQADEALMADISTRTGGTNLFVDVTTFFKTTTPLGDCDLSLANSLAEAYQTQLETARMMERIATFCGPLPPSSTAPPEDILFEIRESGLTQPTFWFNWDDRFAAPRVDLFNPAGDLIGDASASIYENETHKVFHLSVPLTPGVWKATIQTLKQTDVGQYVCGLSARSHEGVRFDLLTAQIPSDMTVTTPLEGSAVPGVPVQLVGFLTDSMGVVLGSEVHAEVGLPNGAMLPLHLFDDGAHNDGQADDGVYGALFTPTMFSSIPEQDNDVPMAAGTPRRGSYILNVDADGISNFGSLFHRHRTAALHFDLPVGGNDRDKDQLLDTWEIYYKGDLTTLVSGTDDLDNDGLSNAKEQELGTNPCDPDTDDGGEQDGSEVQGGRNPLEPSDDGIKRPRDFGPYEPESHEPINPEGLCVLLRYPDNPIYQAIEVHRLAPQEEFKLLTTLQRASSKEPFTEIRGIFVDKDVKEGEQYKYRIRGIGFQQQISAPSRIVCVTAKEDQIPPDGALLIQPSPLTPILEVDVLLIHDGTPTHYRMGNSPIGGTEPLMEMDPKVKPFVVDWKLMENGSGPRTVYAMLYDAAGNQSDQLNDTVRYSPGTSGTPTETPTGEITPTSTPTPTQDGMVTETPTTTLCPDVDWKRVRRCGGFALGTQTLAATLAADNVKKCNRREFEGVDHRRTHKGLEPFVGPECSHGSEFYERSSSKRNSYREPSFALTKV